ncbi:ADP-ribosyl cyclase/cyclic ADP-ribose hydrolase 2 isoform X2 [Narcine bancroftii]|uniref:ADP-ribosyl cyclase/cyclic ADP-ribose hydrolase 2 isoform X2 n=1 Tax=Narcine bancroftii TaxID=1343680 RepID=UPI003831342B
MVSLISLHLSYKSRLRHDATMCGLVLLGLIGLSLANSEVDVPKKWKGKGSTTNLQQIMMGRCFDYLEIVNPSAGKKDCVKIWEEFLKAFSGKDPCNVRKEDYEQFLKLTDHDIPVNQSIFWSRTKDLIIKYTDVTQKYMPLERTLIGYLVDGLNWCGKSCSQGLDFESCPQWNDCENNAMRSFWRAASKNYAAKAHGMVTVMLNGSTNGNAFRNGSIFREIELENLDKKVTSVRLWIIDSIDGLDMPLQLLQCVENSDNPVCK